jgi:hypothetical protein
MIMHELSDKEISNVREQSFAFGDVGKSSFIVVYVVGKGVFLIT